MFNQATLIGRLGADPEVKYTKNDKAVANFNIATSKKYKDSDGEWQEKTSWNRVVIWGGSAEAVGEYLHKGSLVAVIGEVQTRSYEKDDEKVYVTEIVVSGFDGTKVVFLDGKAKDEDDGERSSSKSKSKEKEKVKEKKSSKSTPVDDEDIPF